MHCRLFPSGRRLSRCPESNIAIPWGPSSRAAKRTSRGPRRPIKRGFAPFSLSFLLIPLLHTSLHSSYPHSTLHSSFAVSLLALVVRPPLRAPTDGADGPLPFFFSGFCRCLGPQPRSPWNIRELCRPRPNWCQYRPRVHHQ